MRKMAAELIGMFAKNSINVLLESLQVSLKSMHQVFKREVL